MVQLSNYKQRISTSQVLSLLFPLFMYNDPTTTEIYKQNLPVEQPIEYDSSDSLFQNPNFQLSKSRSRYLTIKVYIHQLKNYEKKKQLPSNKELV